MPTYPNSKIGYPEGGTLVPLKDLLISDRARKDKGDIQSLADSIKSCDLINPILVNRDKGKMSLVAGERRTLAHQLLGLEHVAAVFYDELSPDQQAELELEENRSRNAFKWTEEVCLIAKTHELKRAKEANGNLNEIELAIFEAKGGKTWGQRHTAALMGKGVSSGYVSEAKKLAIIVASGDLEILAASSPKVALDIMAKRAEDKITANITKSLNLSPPSIGNLPTALPISGPLNPKTLLNPTTISSSPSESEPNGDMPPVVIELSKQCILGKVEDLLPKMDPESVHHIITDPPYGIDMKALEGMKGIDEMKDTHKVEENLELLAWFIEASFRIIKPEGFMFLWCDPIHFMTLVEEGEYVGWHVQQWPLVWKKLHPCKNSQGFINTTKDFEFCVKFRKGAGKLVETQQTSIVEADSSAERALYDNPFAKPFKCWSFLLKMAVRDGQTVLDPFGGEFSFARAAINHNVFPVSFECDETRYNKGVKDLSNHYKSMFPQGVTFK